MAKSELPHVFAEASRQVFWLVPTRLAFPKPFVSKGVSGHIEPVMMELTAAGLHGIFTRFPNP